MPTPTLRVLVAILSIAAAAPAAAQPVDLAPGGFISEIKIGAGMHDVGVFGTRKEESGVDVNAEVLFASPGFFSFLFSPRPHLGLVWNTAGDTSQLYGGLTWQYDFEAGMFLAGSLGLALHDGELDTHRPDRKSLGLRVLFRESLEVGYRFGEQRRHSMSLMGAHVSNAWLDDQNEGMDTLVVRYGYRF